MTFLIFLIFIFLLQVGFRRPNHANNNLIAIIPIDTENDTQTSAPLSQNVTGNVDVKISNSSLSTKSTNQSFNNEGKIIK